METRTASQKDLNTIVDWNEKDGDKDGEEREKQEEHENSSDDQDNDTHDKNAHEAREENYKGDDASSAVAHDNQVISTETEKVSSENCLKMVQNWSK
jgi:hypothetical protein